MTSWVGAERVVIDAWIVQQIASIAATLETISVGLSTRLFEGIAPKGTEYPFITYQVQIDPRDIRGTGTTTVMVESQYLVKVWTAGALSGNAGLALAAISKALTTSTGAVMPNGGTILDSVRINGMHLDETVDGKLVRQIGGIFDIHAQG